MNDDECRYMAVTLSEICYDIQYKPVNPLTRVNTVIMNNSFS